MVVVIEKWQNLKNIDAFSLTLFCLFSIGDQLLLVMEQKKKSTLAQNGIKLNFDYFYLSDISNNLISFNWYIKFALKQLTENLDFLYIRQSA